MRHYSQEEWLEYIENRTPDEERAVYEEHLYACEVCLNVYVHAVERTLPLPATPILPEKAEPPKWYTRPVLLYAAACAITVLLMTSGVFDKLTSQIDHFESHSASRETVSYSDQLMHKTVAVLDAFQPKEKGGTRVEP